MDRSVIKEKYRARYKSKKKKIFVSWSFVYYKLQDNRQHKRIEKECIQNFVKNM